VIINKTKKLFSIAMLAMVGVSGMAQDLIAMQAPSDKRMKEIRDVKLTHTLKTDLQNPASDIYTDWRNEFVSAVAGHVPANFKVDLRGFCMPTTSRVVTSNFGPRWRRQHAGIDVKVYIGDTIRAAFDGKVRITKYDRRGYGYFVVIRHPNGLETLYGHLSKIIAKEDAVVKAGDIIGLGGNTGRSTGSHLHFETRLLGQAINPAFMFDFEKQDVTSDFYVCNNKAMTRGKEDLMDIEQMENEVALREGSVLISTGISEQSLDEEENKEVVDTKQSKKSKAVAKREPRKMEKAKNGVHIVKQGDTLSAIAKANHTTVAALCKKNGIKENSMLSLNQKIKI
jgi:murein DD-endopeptidase MepM/ murein hydrolase activator NlpD